MVSFQCNSCGDVVKKPKLDQHNSRCYSGFDCIDCSKTFSTAAQWKTHTSCISEAEKYQKALYKGPKTGEDRAKPLESQPHAAANGYGNGYNNNSRGGFGGRGRGGFGRGGRGGGGGGGRAPVIRMTGANDTPLGATTRFSPVVLPPIVPSEEPKPVASQAVANGVPVKDVALSAESSGKSEKKKKSKKRKSLDDEVDGREPAQKKAKVTEDVAMAAPESEIKERKKEKKAKVKSKEVDGEVKEKKKKSKKDKEASVEEKGSEDSGEVSKKKAKKKKEKESKSEASPKKRSKKDKPSSS